MALSMLVLAAWLGLARDSLAAPGTDPSLEYSVKGAFLFKFIAFVEWPATAFAADAPLMIMVLGDDPFGPILDQLAKEYPAQGRPVTVRRTRFIEEARGAHILYISQSEKNNMRTILQALQGRHVLTVADFDHPGIVIAFIIDTNKVRFDINLDQAERFGLKLSSKLLSVARTVNGR